MNRATLLNKAIGLREWCRRHPVAIGALAALVFLAILVPALIGYQRRHLHLHTGFLPIALALAVPLVALNAVEFMVIGRLASERIPRRQALHVSLGGSVANLLPIPGSIVLRTGVLVTSGTSLSTALHAIMRVGLVWVGVSLTAFGAAGLGRDPFVGAISLGVGLVLTVSFSWLVARQATDRSAPNPRRHRRTMVLVVLGVEIGTVAVESARLWAVLHMLGFHADPLQGMALSTASVLTTASGIFPAGLGLREGLSAAFGAASGLPATIAVTASVVDRLVVLACLGLCSLGLLLWKRSVAPVA